MATPHIEAEDGAFAPAVLMPGDPKRAAAMTDQLLTDAEEVTAVRGILGFTGTVANGPYRGRPLSIMASGMGMPSIGIYASELFDFYHVQRIIRVGTAGGIAEGVNVGDVVIGTGAHTTSNMNELRIPGTHFSAVADFHLAAAAWQASQAIGDTVVHLGTVISEDHFYFKVPGQMSALQGHGVLAVEMEAAGLYGVAAQMGRQALGIFTISDHLTKEANNMTAEQRQSNFATAATLAVAAALTD
ncbi:MAG: purine-nucleoside phosphorylase [Propionibacteriaceae bacterium]|jgi:purine-nucleoside phosphorylase|nr:purine-nucleoside phosphorylase [Propionibacteriaceae bacterium]